MITFTSEQLAAWYGALFWPLTRVLALFASAPLLAHRAIPVRIKVALGLAIAIVLMPGVSAPPISDVMTAPGLALLVQNILIGLIIGFTVRLIFAALEITGELIGLQMGLSFAGFFNPATGQAQTPVASFVSALALLMFVAIDGHLLLIYALGESFRLFPLSGGEFALPLTFERLVRYGAEMFAIGLAIALPFLAVMLLTNVVLGVLARIAPQLNIFAVGFPLTLLVGMAVLLLLLPHIEAPLRAALERGVGAWVN
jgi:flagellar biosynthetic protein FliR